MEKKAKAEAKRNRRKLRKQSGAVSDPSATADDAPESAEESD